MHDDKRVSGYMSLDPVTIEADASIIEAHRVMRERGVRHLPVFDGGRLAGLVSEQDVHLVESLKEVDPAEEPVDAAMDPDPLVVRADMPLDVVIERMLADRIDAAVVVEGHRVVGVLTRTDVLRAFLDEMRRARMARRGVARVEVEALKRA